MRCHRPRDPPPTAPRKASPCPHAGAEPGEVAKRGPLCRYCAIVLAVAGRSRRGVAGLVSSGSHSTPLGLGLGAPSALVRTGGRGGAGGRAGGQVVL